MQGVLSQTGGQDQPMPQEQAPQQQRQSMRSGEKRQGTPAEVQTIADFVMSFFYSEQGLAQLDQRINDPESLSSLIGRMLTTVVQSSVAERGQPVPPEVLMPAAIKIGKGLGELAAQTYKMEGEAEIIEPAMFKGIAKFAKEAKEEALSQEERQAYVQLLGQLNDMKKGGMKPQQEPEAQQPQPEEQV